MSSPSPSHSQTSPRPSVFLSYASADRPAARALRDVLASAGLDVWLDEEELAGGEAWDAKIRQQIRSCTYLMPVISATTEARSEGYFRREWRLAVERTLDLADDVLFLVPVVIDDTRDAGARVPEKFFSVQWLRVPGGRETPALRALAERLAHGDTRALPRATHSHMHASRPATPPPVQGHGEPPPLVPPAGSVETEHEKVAFEFPPFPEKPATGGEKANEAHNKAVFQWFNRSARVVWNKFPRWARVLITVAVVFKVVTFILDSGPSRKRSAGSSSDKSSPPPPTAPSVSIGNSPLGVVTFGSAEGDTQARAYASAVFGGVFQRLVVEQRGTPKLHPIPPTSALSDAEAFERGTKMRATWLLAGDARRPSAGDSVQLTVKLYDVKAKAVAWTGLYVPADHPAETAAREIATAVLGKIPAAPSSTPSN